VQRGVVARGVTEKDWRVTALAARRKQRFWIQSMAIRSKGTFSAGQFPPRRSAPIFSRIFRRRIQHRRRQKTNCVRSSRRPNDNRGFRCRGATAHRQDRCMGIARGAEKHKDPARQVFERSAEQVNFFEHGKNRLVMSLRYASRPPSIRRPTKREVVGGGGDGLDGLGLDPLLIAHFLGLAGGSMRAVVSRVRDERVTNQ
jgi:hypothetical protein